MASTPLAKVISPFHSQPSACRKGPLPQLTSDRPKASSLVASSATSSVLPSKLTNRQCRYQAGRVIPQCGPPEEVKAAVNLIPPCAVAERKNPMNSAIAIAEVI